jgi:peptidoglycan/LPS O-acetylase OafA/YrhL
MANFPPWTQAAALIAGSIGIPALLYVTIEKPLVLAGAHVARRLLRHSIVGQQHQPT